MADSKGNIWIGVTGKGIDHLNKSTWSFSHYDPLPEGEKLRQEQTIRALVEDNSGMIWAAIPDHGLFVLDPHSSFIRRYGAEGKEEGALTNSPRFMICICVRIAHCGSAPMGVA